LKKLRRVVSLAFRLAVSLGLVVWMLSRLDTRDMGGFLARADLLLVGVTLATVVLDRFLMAARWIYLLEALGFRESRARVMKIFFLSTFFGSFLPSGVGGDAVRTVSFSRLSAKVEESLASVVMDRFLGMLSMFLTALVSLSVFYHLYPHPMLLLTVGLFLAAIALGLAVLLSPSLSERALGRLGLAGEPRGPAGWRGGVARTLLAFGSYRRHLGKLAAVLVFSLGVQVLRIFQAFLLSEAMSLGTPLVYFFCFIPIILIVTMLPVSVSGWGPTNLAYLALFAPLGMDPDGAFVLSALILGLGVVGNLPGGVIYALEGFSATRAASGVEKPTA
jgi:uncharacterized membrane protein YbhN (UPF0104 family)